MRFLALTVLLCFSSLAFCQQSAKTRVVFDCQCEDAVGHLYATAFRDVLATESVRSVYPGTPTKHLSLVPNGPAKVENRANSFATIWH
jgi:hypothetical protein